MRKQNSAFTLVELIVVITILAILGTIGFISLQGFNSGSRDSKRLSDLSNIRSGLDIYASYNYVLPIPENSVTVGSGTTDYIIQGYAGENILNSIKVSLDAIDPLDDEYYTYSISPNRKKLQLVSMLENGGQTNQTSAIPKTYANYENREAYTIGDPLGTLLQTTTNTPVHQLESITDIDLENDTTEYIPVFTREDNNTTSSGAELVTRLEGSLVYSSGPSSAEETGGNEPEALTGWRALDPNCEIEDITIGGQTWAGCNSTLGDGIEYGQLDSDVGNNTYNGTLHTSYGCYGYDYSGNDNNDCTLGSSILSSSGSTKAYFEMKQGVGGTNSNGDSEYDTIWGKLYTWNNSDSACPSGWRVPTDEEWKTLTTNLNGGTVCETGTNRQCTGLGWNGHNSKTDTNNLANALKIPLAGARLTDSSTFIGRGRNVNLWSSTLDGSTGDAFRRLLIWNGDGVHRHAFRDYAFSVRCLKD